MSELNAKLEEGTLSEGAYWGTVQYSLRKMMETMDFLNEKGFSHNDLKPGNVMIDETTGELKVIDLGTVNPLGAKVEGVDNPTYRAPEDFDEHSSTPSTDAFATGATIFASVMEKDTFHYGDEERMESSFMYKQVEQVKEYGKKDTDEGAFPQGGKLDSSEGTSQGTSGKSGKGNFGDSQKQFESFMNALMHPDPSKRLSPKQALNHPFLSDSLMDDEKAKELIKQMAKEPIDD